VVLRVGSVDASALRDLVREQRELPVPPKLGPGDTLDGLTVTGVLHESRVTRLYQVASASPNPRQLVLKTLTEAAALDAHERLAFAHEMWLAKRVVARYFASTLELGAPSSLYFLNTYHPGASLGQHLAAGRHYTVPEALKIGMELCRALGALHRRSIVHRDVKPDNVHIGDDGQLRLLDLGVATSGFEVAELSAASRAGTPSFLAPELFTGGSAGVPTDIYAWGVTLYFVLTRQYPYGEIEPFQTPRFGDAAPLTRHRPEVPGWLDNIVMKALAINPTERFETAEELLLTLEQGPLSQAAAPRRRPLATRNLLRTWQVLTVLSVLGNVALIYALVVR
jgi:serine/threonine protein kinase